MRRYLIVANQTLGGQELLDLVTERNARGPAEFHVVVPATPTVDDILAAGAMYGGVLSAEGLAMPLDTGDESTSYERAQRRLERALARLEATGATATGEVGDPDPLVAVEVVLSQREVDEVIVSTLPPGISRWLKMDLVNRVERRVDVPVVHVFAAEEPAVEEG